MSTIVNTFISSAGSFPLQQACSKVISAVAIHGIELTMSGNEKSEIIGSLCKPLSDVLMGSPESAASGSALCLKALVDCENWSFATNELVNDVCLKVARALEGSETQTNFHMALALSLASRNGLILEAYARSIIWSGIRILESSSFKVNLHKRFTSIQMIVCIMKCIDSRSFSSEVGNILDVMEIFSLDPMECVRKAAFEASRTAKRICFLKDSSFVTRSNFSKGASRQNQSFCRVSDASGKNYSMGRLLMIPLNRALSIQLPACVSSNTRRYLLYRGLATLDTDVLQGGSCGEVMVEQTNQPKMVCNRKCRAAQGHVLCTSRLGKKVRERGRVQEQMFKNGWYA